MKDLCDLYPNQINFTYHGFYLYPSVCGFLLSIIIEGLLIAYLVYLLIDMTNRELPQISRGASYNDFPSQIKINSAPTVLVSQKKDEEFNLFFSCCIYDGECVSASSKNLEIKAYQYNITENGNILSNEIQFVDADKSQIEVPWNTKDPTAQSVPKNSQFADGTLVLKDEFYLNGTYRSPMSKWLEIHVTYTGNNPDELNGVQFEYYQETKSLNGSAYEDKMIGSDCENLYWNLVPGYTKIVNYPLIKEKLKTNDYYLPRFLIPKEERYFLSPGVVSEQMKDEDDKEGLLVFRYYLSRQSKETERNFEDVLTILAIIGGLAGFVVTICIIFVYSIRSFRMNLKVLNDCYYICEPSKNEFPTLDKFLQNIVIEYNSTGNQLKKRKEKNSNENIGETLMNAPVEYKPELDHDPSYLNNSEITPLKKFFNLRRIQDLYGISDDELKKIRNKASAEAAINPTKADKYKYAILKIIYDASKYKSEPDFDFCFFKMLGYYLFNCCCCSKKKKLYSFEKPKKGSDKNSRGTMTNRNYTLPSNPLYTETVGLTEHEQVSRQNTSQSREPPSRLNTQQSRGEFSRQNTQQSGRKSNPNEETYRPSELEKNYAIYKGGTMKLGIDFDVVEILTKISEFDYFTRVVLNPKQRELFYALSKPVIKLDKNEKRQKKITDDKEEQEFEDLINFNRSLIRLTKKGELKDYHIKLLQLSGITKEDINNYIGLIDELNTPPEERLDKSQNETNKRLDRSQGNNNNNRNNYMNIEENPENTNNRISNFQNPEIDNLDHQNDANIPNNNQDPPFEEEGPKVTQSSHPKEN